MTWSEITTVAALEERVGRPTERVANKTRPVLHDLDRQWLAASRFCLIATSSDTGTCDVSRKGDLAGQLAYVLANARSPSPSGRATAGSTATAT